ncbi:L-threonylcarbamoyladenylate synthase [Dichotomicrobium thermohalophilum]|uniref:Threonylcarbamoyl-AMP synthase n=1 Tax=Dichotomicrobium thermohalophilum TaxID=933063 RepID=A0A397Q3D5_9HYPH|nr:L-threonylcarbamoyladenylate synthase [Dichotomicrobium thermohalophilum]RIA55876.1 translation factor SUA5 [Dichotomicrobium thermohalophilum]
MQVLSPSDENIALAASFLRDGSLVAFPTETVYGLGANANDGRAIARLYEAKGRPRFNPLIVHVADREHAERLGVFDDRARLLAEQFWPGPLTLVVPLVEGAPINSLVTAGLDTVGLRVPSHPIAQKLIQFSRVPVAAPSANRSGRVSPTTAEHVAGDFENVKGLIVNGGRCPGGLESTVVGLAGDAPLLLRPGGIPRDEIETELGEPLHQPEHKPDAPASPGMLTSHYAPRARVRLNAQQARPGEVLLGFGPDAPPETILNLSERGDLTEASANLFGYLRAMDTCRADTIAVMPIPNEGLGEAINDRLARAAAPKRNGG